MSLAAVALAQLPPVAVVVVVAAAADVLVLTVMFAVVAVLARGDPSPPSAGLIVATCPTQRQCLCLRHILMRLGHLEGGSPWLHGRQWPQATLLQKRGVVSPFNRIRAKSVNIRTLLSSHK